MIEINSFVRMSSYNCRLLYEFSPLGIYQFQLVSQRSELDVVATIEGPKQRKLENENVSIGIWP